MSFMYESERSQQDTDRELFDGLIDTLREQDDSGIVAFEWALKEAQEYLTSEYVKAGEPVNYKDLADIEQDLGNDWGHEGDIARLSGMLYLNDLDEESTVEKVLGVAKEDSNGNKYYIVENCELKSAGIDIMTSQTGDGRASSIRVGYTFSLLDDEDDLPTLRAYPDDLYQHRYEKPTIQQAIEQLEKHWPKQFLLLREWAHFIGETPLPARLHYIAVELQKELAESEEFRRFIECYLQECVPLDQTLPFNLVISGDIDYYDGETSPYSEGKDAKWTKLHIDGQQQEYGYYPKIELVRRKNGAVDATLLFATYNNEDGDAAEYVRLSADTVQLFRPTRSIGSLASRAMAGGQEMVLEVVSKDIFGTVSPVQPEEMESELDETSSENDVPELIQGLIQLEEAFSYIVKLIEAKRTVAYASAQDAHEAAVTFIHNDLKHVFSRFGSLVDIQLTVSGSTILRPQGAGEFLKDKKSKKPGRNFTYQLNHDNPVGELQEGDVVSGALINIVPDITQEESFLDSAPKYKIYPRMLLSIGRQGYVPVARAGTPLVQVHVDERILVPFDEKTEIKFTTLESYRKSQSSVREFNVKYPDLKVTNFINELNHALINEETTLIDFNQIELFASLKAKKLEKAGGEVLLAQVVDTLDAMLVGRKLQVAGEVYRKKKNGTYASVPMDGGEGMVGVVVDVRSDIKKGEVFICLNVGPDVHNPKTMVFARAHTMTAFRF